MKTPSPLPQPPHPAVAAARAFDAILVNLLRLMTQRSAFFGAIFMLVSRRVSRVRRHIFRLLTALAAGRLPRQRASAAPRPPAPPGDPKPAYVPRRRAWLVAIMGYQAAGYASHLQHLLDDPATRAMLDAAPPAVLASAGRSLRPLCRLLGVTLPPSLQLPPKPPRPKPVPIKPPPLPPLLPLHPQSRPRPLPFLDFAAHPRVSKMRPT